MKSNVFAGKYEILETIGTGAMCDVFRANHMLLGLPVALKVLKAPLAASREGRERFINEARLASRLHHPNIVQVYEVYQYEDRPYIAMEYVDGTSFRQLVTHKHSIYETVRILIDVADALHYAHEKRVLHRDLKPDNILVAENGEVKVADWGLSKAMGTVSRLTRPGVVLGTPDYMSPEQIKSKSQALTNKSDLYAFGVILYEAVAGAPPFNGGNTADILQGHLHRIPPPLKNVIPSLSRLVEQLLAKSPDLRPAAAGDVAKQLRSLLANLPYKAKEKEQIVSTRVQLPAKPTLNTSLRPEKQNRVLTQMHLVLPEPSTVVDIDELLLPVRKLDDEKWDYVFSSLAILRKDYVRAFRDSDRAAVKKRFRDGLLKALKAVSIDEDLLVALKESLRQVLSGASHIGSSIAKSLLPLRYLEAAMAERELDLPPWGSINSALGFTFAAGRTIKPDEKQKILARASFLNRTREGTMTTYLANAKFIKQMKEKPFFRSLVALAARNVLLEERETIPETSQFVSEVLKAVTIPPMNKMWPPKSLVLALSVREFARETALLVRINDGKEMVVLNTAYNSISNKDFYLCDPLVVSFPIPPEMLEQGTNTIRLRCAPVPFGKPVHGLALREVALLTTT